MYRIRGAFDKSPQGSRPAVGGKTSHPGYLQRSRDVAHAANDILRDRERYLRHAANDIPRDRCFGATYRPSRGPHPCGLLRWRKVGTPRAHDETAQAKTSNAYTSNKHIKQRGHTNASDIYIYIYMYMHISIYIYVFIYTYTIYDIYI